VSERHTFMMFRNDHHRSVLRETVICGQHNTVQPSASSCVTSRCGGEPFGWEVGRVGDPPLPASENPQVRTAALIYNPLTGSAFSGLP
jgi:hypothetical protein